ncbi:hypothetical protein O3M35_002477 [Rhynocoris fuscipes]|uniref:Magnesium-dependent phosphatase 1 n=1 Tax=Rhynocoris fuscipes TaxID=488301 RepID=A0AAW1CN02_9HEMI
MAVASRITDIALAYQLLHLLDLRKYFICVEIYPTRKTLHFTQIQKKTGLPFRDMVFYDDDVRNLKCIDKLGVRVIQVVDGINGKVIQY